MRAAGLLMLSDSTSLPGTRSSIGSRHMPTPSTLDVSVRRERRRVGTANGSEDFLLCADILTRRAFKVD